MNTPYEAARDADALLILTEWDEFATLDLDRLAKEMKYPIVIDGRNLYDPEDMAAHGFTYYSVGRRTAPDSRSRMEPPPRRQGKPRNHEPATRPGHWRSRVSWVRICVTPCSGKVIPSVAVDNLLTGRQSNLDHLRNEPAL